MAVKNSFFWNGSDEYGEEEIAAVHEATIRPGIKVDDAGNLCFAVTSPSNGKISIDPGIAHLSGPAWFYKSTATALTVTADSTYNRIDRVVLYADFVGKKTGIEIKKGTASSAPVAPALQRDTRRYELSLARVTVKPGGSTTVTDERVNTTVCGAVRMRDCSEFDSYFKMIQKSFDNWFNTQQGAGWRQFYIQSTTPPSTVVDGALWLDTGNNNQLKEYEIASENQVGTWKNIYVKPNVADIYRDNSNKLFGVKMAGDIVRGHTVDNSVIGTLPFNTARDGFVTKTDYAELQSDGSVRITRKGYYDFSANVFISDSPGLEGTYHMRIVKRNTDFTIGENYVHTSTINPNHICSGNPSGYDYCNVGDIIAIYVAPPRYQSMYRVDQKHTHFEIAPYAFFE
jgi:hypothetical protein